MATVTDDKDYDLESENDVYDILEKMRCSKNLAEKRIKIVENAERNGTVINRRNWANDDSSIVIPGSIGEGVWALESDIDFLFVQNSVKCFEKNPSTADNKKYEAVFQLDTENAPSGYTWLESKTSLTKELGKQHSVMENLRRASYKRNGKMYLRNDGFFVLAIEDNETMGGKAHWYRKHFQFEERSGPSRAFNVTLPLYHKYLPVDYVPAFPCSYPSIEDWCDRRRKYDWPSKKLVKYIRNSDVYVVPVGRKDTDDNFLQWRLSFTIAERALVRSFNDTQIKLYMAIKLLVKFHLNLVCENITSYVVKNVVFWAVEETEAEKFTKDNFCKTLIQILGRMKVFIEKNHLPSYMMPERNLLGDKISENERIRLLKQLEEIKKDVKKALIVCPVIQETLQPKEEVMNKLKWRAFAEEVMAAIGALPAEQCDKFEKMVHRADERDQMVAIYLHEVIPYIRQENPYGFFDNLVSMSNAELLKTAMEMYIVFSRGNTCNKAD